MYDNDTTKENSSKVLSFTNIRTSHFFDTEEALIDIKNGKKMTWKEHRIMTNHLAEAYERLDNPKAIRVRDCGTFLTFKHFPDGSKKFSSANFCKVRLCPMCSWRRSLKIFGQVSKVMNYLQTADEYADNEFQFLFLTVSRKNVREKKLSNELDELFYTFMKMTKKRQFVRSIQGWFRCLEITYNQDRADFHPHFHMVLVVDKEYFTSSDLYISQPKWTKLWKEAAGIDYKPIVHIQAFKASEKGLGKEVAEVAKYAVKPSDLIIRDRKTNAIREQTTDFVVSTFDEVLNKRRLIAFGGVMKDAHKKLNLDDAEDGDLIHIDPEEDETREDLNYILSHYRWNIGAFNYTKVILKEEDEQ